MIVSVLGGVISCSPANPQLSDSFTPTKNSRPVLCLEKKRHRHVSASQTRSSKAAYYADAIFYFLLIDTTKGAVRVRLSGSQFSVVTRGMRGGLQFIR